MAELLKRLPEGTRDNVYTIAITLGLLLGAINVGFMTATGDVPLALNVVNAVALFLGVPLSSGTAKANIGIDHGHGVEIDMSGSTEADVEFHNPDSPQFETETR